MRKRARIDAKILLAEDHRLIRGGLRSLLESAGATVVGEASDGQEAVRLAIALQPNVVLMDLSMPLLNGVDATRQLHEALPNTRIVVLSMHTESTFIYDSVRAGASAYVLKDAAFDELINAIDAALQGRTYLSPAVEKLAVDDYLRRARGPEPPSDLDKLSGREREVLRLIAEGKPSTEIAQALQIAVRTVDAHRQSLMNKLGVHSVAGLTKLAVQHGLSSLNDAGNRRNT